MTSLASQESDLTNPSGSGPLSSALSMNSSAWLAALRQHLHLKTVDLEPLLHQASPLQHCRTAIGARQVLRLLQALEQGAPV
jgi:hypothetical protein